MKSDSFSLWAHTCTSMLLVIRKRLKKRTRGETDFYESNKLHPTPRRKSLFGFQRWSGRMEVRGQSRAELPRGRHLRPLRLWAHSSTKTKAGQKVTVPQGFKTQREVDLGLANVSPWLIRSKVSWGLDTFSEAVITLPAWTSRLRRVGGIHRKPGAPRSSRLVDLPLLLFLFVVVVFLVRFLIFFLLSRPQCVPLSGRRALYKDFLVVFLPFLNGSLFLM